MGWLKNKKLFIGFSTVRVPLGKAMDEHNTQSMVMQRAWQILTVKWVLPIQNDAILRKNLGDRLFPHSDTWLRATSPSSLCEWFSYMEMVQRWRL